MTALVESTSIPERPDLICYRISAATLDDCWSAIEHIMDAHPLTWFDPPRKDYSIHDASKRWRTTGYVRT